jgi:hypothetical protein
MRTEATSLDATRHRLLEGILLRLARLPDAGGLVLRGGMLLRHWFRPIPRPVGDLDLVTTSPLGVDEAMRLFLPLLGEGTVADGVTFDVERVRADAICLTTGSPGVRVFASGCAGPDEIDFHIDVTLDPSPRPAPVLGDLPTACGEPARVWMCRPESIVGQKMQALAHLGMLCWRPKDLDDLRLLLARMTMDDSEMGEAIAESFAALGRTGADARAVLGPSAWWGMKRSSARWLDFVKSSRGRDVPRDLAAVVAEVAGRLAPVLEGLP